jgi:putative Holliday junction resolvase
MRVLALDYGSARCGCAISDPTGTIVTPIEAIASPRSRRGMAALKALVIAREVERVVVGLPLSLRGTDTTQTRETREFAQRLTEQLLDIPGHANEVPVELYDERFTTRLAQRMQGATTAEDSRAAAHMLESWLTAWQREQRAAAR